MPVEDDGVWTGGPAFPHPEFDRCPRCGEEAVPVYEGFTKREAAALVLMHAMVANVPHDAEVSAVEVAGDSVRLADALLHALATT